MEMFQKKKMNLGLYFGILFIIIALIVVLFIIFKYTVEGEAIPPFKVSKLIVISGAKTDNLNLEEEKYTADVLQNNDVKIVIEKNPEYKKEAIIKKVRINNIQVEGNETAKNIELYRPSIKINGYEYKEEYKINGEMYYIGAQETYLRSETLQIANQGGILEFSIIANDLGTIEYTADEAMKVDGTLLKQIGIEDIKYKVSFDLIIELENDVKLKTKITLELPAGDILENGIETMEQKDLKTIFKRI